MTKLTRVTSKLILCSVLLCGTSSIAANQQSEINEIAHLLIKRFEGFSAKAYPDAITGDAPWAFGYGFTRHHDGRPVKPGDTISKAKADKRLHTELERECGTALQKINADFKSPNRVGAAASFCWNVGSVRFERSKFYKLWASGKIEAASNALMHWVARGTKAEKHLRQRRKTEQSVFRGDLVALNG